jgi:hypothetical protein
MLLFGFYFLFLTIMSVIGFFIGLAAEQSYPGSGNIVTVAVFMIALWAAWTLSVRIVDRYWPDQPAA